MDIIHLIITIVIGGLVYGLVTSLIPLPQQFKTAIYFASCLWLVYVILGAFGAWPPGFIAH